MVVDVGVARLKYVKLFMEGILHNFDVAYKQFYYWKKILHKVIFRIVVISVIFGV